ncbi:MAG TPA: serine/threonine-protein kinase, partial [Candidatus Limnocylindria bacterium]|nr:serine/threonine-protein kinase [Candidatus Limnocylindria bacterium]
MRSIGERFELRERIGGSDTTEVYRAVDRARAEDVVLRLVRPDVAGDEYVERMRREAEAASDIRHPNVVPTLEHGLVEGRVFVARELVEGTALEDVLARRGRLPEDEARNIGEQIARGLEAAHARGVLHRDLNTGNVFITPDGTARIVDFGMPSTPRHPAPEQSEGRTIDERVDVYGLGAVLYQMLTGRIFRGGSVSPRRLARGVSKGLDAVVARALEGDPARRFPSAAAMAQALRPPAPARAAAVLAPRPPRPEPIASPPRGARL